MAVKIDNRLVLVSSALVVSFSCLIAVFCGGFYFSNKGFELSDETYYLFFSNNHNPNTYMITNFGLLNDVFCFGNPTLKHLRLAKLIYQSLAVIFFCFGLFRFLKYKGMSLSAVQRSFIVVISLMLSYINYDYLPMTLSYNTWSFILGLVCFGIFFMDLTFVSKWKTYMAAFFVGMLLFCFFLVKLPGAVFFTFFYLILSFFQIKTLLIKFIFVLAGVFTSYLIFINDFEYLKNIIEDYYITLFEVKHVEANSYFYQIVDLFKLCVEKKYVLVELIVVLMTLVLSRINMPYKLFLSHLLIVLNLSLTFLFCRGNGSVLHNDFLAGVLFILTIGIYAYLIPLNSRPKHDLVLSVISAMLIVTPFLLMLGTNNSFYYTTSHIILFAYIGVLLFTLRNGDVLNEKNLALNSLFICSFIVILLVNGAIKNPYRQSDLMQKKYTLNFSKEIKGIEESRERYIDYNVLHNLVVKCNPKNKQIITTFNYFGLCYLNDVSVFPESQISDSEKYIYISKYLLDRYKFDDKFDLIIIPETAEKSQVFKELFGSYGVNLGDNYKLFYQYKFLSTGENVFFYKHV